MFAFAVVVEDTIRVDSRVVQRNHVVDDIRGEFERASCTTTRSVVVVRWSCVVFTRMDLPVSPRSSGTHETTNDDCVA